jgi:hypothetical protein
MSMQTQLPPTTPSYNPRLSGERRKRIRRYITHSIPFGPIDSSDVDTSDTDEMQELFDRNNAIYHRLDSHKSMLIGRKGSGKTAYLRSMFLDARAGDLDVVQLRTASMFQEVLKAINNDLEGIHFVELIADIWETLLICSVLSEILARHGKTNPGLRCVADYLGKLGINVDKPRTPDDVLWTIVRTLASRKGDNVVNSIAAVIQGVAGASYRDALTAVKQFLENSGRNVVILIDSLDEYSLDTQEVGRAIKGLLRCVGRFPARQDRIQLRFCLPAELYHRFMELAANAAKDFQGRLVLQWHPSELIAIAAHRLKIYLREHHPAFYAERKLAHAEPDDRKCCEEILYSVLPPTIRNGRGATEDTLVYLLRHTQLLPRHLLMYLNRIFDRAKLQEKVNAPVVTARDLVSGVRQTEAILVQELFGAYQPIHPCARDVCKACLPELPQSFPQGELHRIYNRHGRAKMHGAEFADFMKMLVEIGAIGKCVAQTERYLEAEFEYTLPDQLPIGAKEELCLHPMFMRVFQGIRQEGAGPVVLPRGSRVTDEDCRDLS